MILRRAGLKPDPNKLTPEQFEGVAYWEQIQFEWEMAFQQAMIHSTLLK